MKQELFKISDELREMLGELRKKEKALEEKATGNKALAEYELLRLDGEIKGLYSAIKLVEKRMMEE